jgi:heme exporter protein C
VTLIQRLAISPHEQKNYSFFLAKYAAIIWLISIPPLLLKISSLPEDLYQKEHVKMLFLHVPSSFLSLFFYTAQAIGAVFFLIWPIKPLKSLVLSTHQVTIFFVLQSLISGSLWGYPTWGTWWAWDARMTSQLVLFTLLILQYIVLKAPVYDKKKVFRFYCVLLIIGFIDIPIVHYSVTWWNTLHQGYSLSLTEGVKIDLVYLYPLIASMTHQFIWGIALVFYSFSSKSFVQCTLRAGPSLYYEQKKIVIL